MSNSSRPHSYSDANPSGGALQQPPPKSPVGATAVTEPSKFQPQQQLQQPPTIALDSRFLPPSSDIAQREDFANKAKQSKHANICQIIFSY